jgi:hypothetical protein
MENLNSARGTCSFPYGASSESEKTTRSNQSKTDSVDDMELANTIFSQDDNAYSGSIDSFLENTKFKNQHNLVEDSKPHEIATLPLIPGADTENALIKSNMLEVLGTNYAEGKGKVFLHLARSINKLQRELFQSKQGQLMALNTLPREKLLNELRDIWTQLNGKKAFDAISFKNLVIKDLYLNELDKTGTILSLRNCDFTGAHVLYTEMCNTDLTDTKWEGSTVINLITDKKTILPSDENFNPQEETSIQARKKEGNCIIS